MKQVTLETEVNFPHRKKNYTTTTSHTLPRRESLEVQRRLITIWSQILTYV